MKYATTPAERAQESLAPGAEASGALPPVRNPVRTKSEVADARHARGVRHAKFVR